MGFWYIRWTHFFLRCMRTLLLFSLFLFFKCIDHLTLLYLFALKMHVFQESTNSTNSLAQKIRINSTDVTKIGTLLDQQKIRFAADAQIHYYTHFLIPITSIPHIVYGLITKNTFPLSVQSLLYAILGINIIQFGLFSEIILLCLFFYFFGDISCKSALSLVSESPILTWVFCISLLFYVWVTSKIIIFFFTLLPKREDGVSPLMHNVKHFFNRDNKVVYREFCSIFWILLLNIIILFLKVTGIGFISLFLFKDVSVFMCFIGFLVLLFANNVYTYMDMYFFPYANITHRHTVFFLLFLLYSAHFLHGHIPSYNICPDDIPVEIWRYALCKIEYTIKIVLDGFFSIGNTLANPLNR